MSRRYPGVTRNWFQRRWFRLKRGFECSDQMIVERWKEMRRRDALDD